MKGLVACVLLKSLCEDPSSAAQGSDVLRKVSLAWTPS